jgi:16S rRNA (uracil1498-N3)-methyltransferase
VRLIRLYTEESLDEDSSVFLKKKSYHYLSKVLRVKEKQSIVLFNNSGFNYHGYVKKITNKDFEIYIDKKVFIEKKDSEIEIAFSVCKNPCSDLIIQKLTELGIDSIQPIISKNSLFNQKKIDSEKKTNHWKNISISACEQSERSYTPEIKHIISFQEYIESCDTKQKIVLDTKSNNMLSKVYDHKVKSCSILIGPEGDFSNEEYGYAKESNFSSASLGANILRVETAAISAFAYIKIMKNSESNE